MPSPPIPSRLTSPPGGTKSMKGTCVRERKRRGGVHLCSCLPTPRSATVRSQMTLHFTCCLIMYCEDAIHRRCAAPRQSGVRSCLQLAAGQDEHEFWLLFLFAECYLQSVICRVHCSTKYTYYRGRRTTPLRQSYTKAYCGRPHWQHRSAWPGRTCKWLLARRITVPA